MKFWKRFLSVIMIVVICLTIAPISGLKAFFSYQASASSYNVCVSSLQPIDFDRYTGNLGDSFFYNLNKQGLIDNDRKYYRNGNIGVDESVYENGFEVWIARWNYTQEISWAAITYDIDGMYDTLSGSTGLIKSYNTNNFDTTVYFYGDDQLLYSQVLTNNNYKFDFNIDVKGVNKLKILVQDNVAAYGGTSFALYDLFLNTTKIPGNTSGIMANGTCGDNLTWTLYNDGELVIKGTGEMYDYSSSPFEEYATSITKVTINNGVTSIGDIAFGFCEYITEVTIPDSVTSIGDYAFYFCDSLTSITIPDSAKSIGYCAFYSCDSLTSITVNENNKYYTSDKNGVLFNKNKTELIHYPIGNERTEYSIPDSVTSIGDYAFEYCSSLTSITIPDSVTSIGKATFAGCESLTNITIPNNATNIGDNAFDNCKSLTSITIPDSVSNIGYLAFYSCDSLTNITVNEHNKYYSSDKNGVLFNKNKTELIQYPIGNERTEYSIPAGVASIAPYAFNECDYLINITIPDSVTTIKLCAFRSCIKLESITIPDSVTSIDDSTFILCKSLKSITVNESNKYYSSDKNGVLFNKNKTELIQYPIGNERTEYSIPDSVTSIGDYAFRFCTNLERITIPDSVTSISDRAFLRNESRTNITVNENNKYFSSDTNGVLFNKNKTELIHYPIGNERTEYSIPDSVTSIGDDAFEYCYSLTSITIPDSVTSIGDYAFYDCVNLNTVYYTGTEDQWNNIDIDAGNECLTNADIIFNSTGSDSTSTFNKNTYIADIWLNRHNSFDSTIENGYINSLVSINGHFSEDLAVDVKNDPGFMNSVVAWKTMEIIFNPAEGTAEAVYLDKNEIYQTLVFDLIKQCLSNEKYSEIMNTEYLEISDNLFGAFGTGCSILNELNIADFEKFKKLALSDDIEMDQKYFKILYDNFKSSEKVFKNFDNFCFIAKGIIKSETTIRNFINKISMYYTAMSLSLDQSAVLYEMATHTKESALKDALITIADIAKSNDFSAGLTDAIIEAGTDTAVYLTSVVTDELMQLIPVYGQLKIIYDVAATAVDLIFNTEDVIDAYYLISCTSELCNASKMSIESLADKYLTNDTESNAGAFIESVKMYIKLIGIDLESGCSFIKAASEDGLYNISKKLDKKILSLFGFSSENTYDEVCKSKDSILNSVEHMQTLLTTSWILNESYLKTDYPHVYPAYALEEIKNDIYTPVITNVRLNKDGETEIKFGLNEWVNGIEAVEEIAGTTTIYTSELSDNIICYNEDKKDIFPKTYTLYSYFDSVQGQLYSNPSEERSVNLPLMTPTVMIPTFKDIMSTNYGNIHQGIPIAIVDKTSTYYNNIKYYIYRKTGDSDYKQIAVIDRHCLFDGKTTLYSDVFVSPEENYSYKVQSELIFNNGVSVISEMSDPITFGDSLFDNRIKNIDINDLRIPNNTPRPFSLLSSRAGTFSNNDEGVKISWEHTENATGYEIYRKPSYGQIYKKIATVTDCFYIDKDISAGESFDYFVIEYSGTEDNKIYADCSDVASIEYKSIDIQNNKTKLYTEESVLLNATTYPSNENIQWFCSDDSVATVDANGLLTALSAGTVKITAMLDNGLSDEIEITVIAKDNVQTLQPGDMNGDGKITASDARAALRISAKLDTPTEEQLTAADVNGDGKITASDARIILRVAAKLETL